MQTAVQSGIIQESTAENFHAATGETPMTEQPQAEDLREGVELADGISVIRGGGRQRQWNNIRYKLGMSGKNVGSKSLSMNVATIPPGGVAYAHIHVDFEVMLYILEGRVRHIYGKGLRKTIDNEAGDFIFIEPGVPHEVYNLSDSEPVVAIVARSSADEWDNIINYDPKTDL
ncbi:cupin domain-containing protein [Anaerolineae bacterium CFX9]|nr:cupin domain-containing protein [Anaerolineae bacterium CFX9]